MWGILRHMLKIMTLNLWHYHDWARRKDAITTLISEHAPDIVAMQEVQTNPAFSYYPQSDIIADACGYEYRTFAPTFPRNKGMDQQEKRTQRVSHGQAFLSRYPIVRSDSYFLKYYPEFPEESSALFCRIHHDDTMIDFCNIHPINNSAASHPQLDELLTVVEARGIDPIILGDFNIYNLAALKTTNERLRRYTLSSEAASYVSYPADTDTLDYVIAPSAKYRLSDVVCPDDYVSDHRALLATITAL